MLTKTHANQYNSKVLPFKDGICAIYTIKNRTADEKLGRFDFREETIGIQAFTEFQNLGIQIDKVISIPVNTVAEIGRIVRINQEPNFYQISMIQRKDTNIPTALRLTLTKTNIKWEGGEDDQLF